MPRMPDQDTLLKGGSALICGIYSSAHLLGSAVYVFYQRELPYDPLPHPQEHSSKPRGAEHT